jgi:integrase
MTKRSYGDGGIDQRGENNFRLRYRIGKKRFAKTFHGTFADAKKELRRLLHSGDTGEHVAPDKATLAGWAEQWIAIGCPGRSKKVVGNRSRERYEQILRMHILPTLGDFKLQDIDSVEIDKLYAGLEGKIAPRSARQVHSVLGALLATAMRTKKIVVNPMNHITKTPSAGESDHGVALDDEQLRKLVQGFRGNQLYGIVSVAAFTGMRRNEILALRWSDLDAAKKTLRIERALEETKQHGIRFKGPKRESHKRTITIDDDLLALPLAERAKHLRLVACAGRRIGRSWLGAVARGVLNVSQSNRRRPYNAALHSADQYNIHPQGEQARLQRASLSRPAGDPRDAVAQQWCSGTCGRGPVRS